MTRPKMTLQEWLDKDAELKKQFIYREIDESGYNGSKLLVLDNNQIKSKYLRTEYFLSGQLSQSYIIRITELDFEKIKNKYRVFKKNENDKDLSRKQYRFKKTTVQKIKKMQKEMKLDSEVLVIEKLIDNFYEEKKIGKVQLDMNRLNDLSWKNTISESVNNLSKNISTLKQDILDLKNENSLQIDPTDPVTDFNNKVELLKEKLCERLNFKK